MDNSVAIAGDGALAVEEVIWGISGNGKNTMKK